MLRELIGKGSTRSGSTRKANSAEEQYAELERQAFSALVMCLMDNHPNRFMTEREIDRLAQEYLNKAKQLRNRSISTTPTPKKTRSAWNG